ncbi:MAG: hypothetical protein NXI04_28470 [Planctomycetaceae bacterium]|nr:hypothetical protein [Planctomycetaceae bacterium]
MARPSLIVMCLLTVIDGSCADDVRRLQRAGNSVGVDVEKGGSITWLSFGESGNVVNIADPGRLIQQSYYAGKSLDRTAQTQHKAWSPWPWNPIQGGGVGAWATASVIREESSLLYSETVPKLWDMADEQAAALMKQSTRFEEGFDNVIHVQCEFQSLRPANDRWGSAAVPRGQELPACYFTRRHSRISSYLGDGRWRTEKYRPGPPWFQCRPPLSVMGCFDETDRGVAVFSPVSTRPWNFGAAGGGQSGDPRDKSCIHIAPVEVLKLGPQSSLKYGYWLVVGTRGEVASSLDRLIDMYRNEKLQFRPDSNSPNDG